MSNECHETLIQAVNRIRKKKYLLNLNNHSLFLEKKNIDKIAYLYKDLYQKKYRWSLSIQVARRHIIILCGSKEYYLRFDSNMNLITGYVITDYQGKASFWLFKKIDGDLFLVTEHLLPEDPIFEDGSCRLINDDEIFVEFEYDFGVIRVCHHAFKRFCERLSIKYSANWAISKKLLHLQKLLRHAEKVYRLNNVIQILKYDSEIVEYRTDASAQWIFVITNQGVLKTCYKKDNAYKSGFSKDKKYASH
ncbi:hypothetical protein ACFL2U_02260 [Patescibacteria group bacterium]